MKICLVAPVSGAAGGGTAAYIRSLGDQLVKAGHQVSGIARIHLHNNRSLSYAESDCSGEKDEPRIVFEGWDCKLVAPKKAFAPLLGKLLHLVTRPVVDRLATRLFQAAYFDSVERCIPSGTQVVHYVGTGWELFGFTARSVASRRRAVFTVTPFVHPEVWGDSRVDIRFYNSTDATLVCSDYERTHLVTRGTNPDVLRHTDMAPAATLEGNQDAFRNRHRLGNRPLILFLARKQAYKGYHALRRSMSLVLEAVPEACLVAAGADLEQPYPPVPENNFLDLGELKPNPTDAQHKADALAACDIFCMPSNAEAFGIAYVEAWSYGKPVIGGTAPALKELILNDVNGYRVEQNEQEIANHLIQLLKDESLRRRLGNEGQRIQREKYNWTSVASQHVKLWQELTHPSP